MMNSDPLPEQPRSRRAQQARPTFTEVRGYVVLMVKSQEVIKRSVKENGVNGLNRVRIDEIICNLKRVRSGFQY